jgi:hypothetical protein
LAVFNSGRALALPATDAAVLGTSALYGRQRPRAIGGQKLLSFECLNRKCRKKCRTLISIKNHGGSARSLAKEFLHQRRDEFLGDLSFEFDAMGTVLGHGFHPLKARQSWSIPNLQGAHSSVRSALPPIVIG